MKELQDLYKPCSSPPFLQVSKSHGMTSPLGEEVGPMISIPLFTLMNLMELTADLDRKISIFFSLYISRPRAKSLTGRSTSLPVNDGSRGTQPTERL